MAALFPRSPKASSKAQRGRKATSAPPKKSGKGAGAGRARAAVPRGGRRS